MKTYSEIVTEADPFGRSNGHENFGASYAAGWEIGSKSLGFLTSLIGQLIGASLGATVGIGIGVIKKTLYHYNLWNYSDKRLELEAHRLSTRINWLSNEIKRRREKASLNRY